MSKKPQYSGIDSSPWKVVTYSGQVVRDEKGKLLQGFNGYKDAMRAAFGMTGVTAVRQ